MMNPRTTIRALRRLQHSSLSSRRYCPFIRQWVRHSSNIPEQQHILAATLAEAIKQTGPITLAQYMRQCLTSPDGGYYTTSADPFGSKGDFTTSPEISQLFGEMIGIWIVAEWMAQKKMNEKSVCLVELGPGRGTLMEDVLRTLRNFKPLLEKIEHIYLVEASQVLREKQCQRICGEGTSPERIKDGWTCTMKAGIPVTWYEDLRLVPQDSNVAPLFLAHEFFDALPIHAFQNTLNGWRELLVDVKPPLTKPSLILPPGSSVSKTPPSKTAFELSLSKYLTGASVLLPQLSKRYRDLTMVPNATIEISTDSHAVVEDISKRIANSHHGAGLIVDYGPADTIPINSLRGIRSHEIVSPFENPGEIDLSVDVDFGALVETALRASEDVEVHGPVEQSFFLLSMGMKERMEVLVKNASEKERVVLEGGHERLVDRGVNGMGRLYKVLAIIPEGGGRRPTGFGGSLIQ